MTVSAVWLGPPRGAGEAVAALPVRLPLSPAAVAWLAATAGVPLPWRRAAPGAAALARRLSGRRDHAGRDEAALRELVRLGAADVDGTVRPAVLTSLDVFGQALVAVDVVLARHTAHGPVILRAWHRRRGDRVTWLTAAGGDVELGWCDLSAWPAQLTAIAAGGDDPVGDGPRAGLALPLPLMLAAGEALATGRDDLLAALEHHPDIDGDGEQLRLAHEGVRARLQVTVAGHGRAGDRRLGLVSWLRFDDGWRSLTPVTRAGAPWIRLDPASPRLLAAQVARLQRGMRAC